MPTSASSRSRDRTSHLEQQVAPWMIGGVALLAAVGAVAADASPTAVGWCNAALAALAAVVIVLAFAWSRRWAWLATAGLAVLPAGGAVAVTCAAIAVAIAFVAGSISSLGVERRRWIGAVTGALTVQVLFRLTPFLFHGADALWAFVVCLPVLGSGYRACRSRSRRRIRLAAAACSAVLVVVVVLAGVSAAGAWNDLDHGRQAADRGLAALRRGDQASSAASLEQAASDFAAAGEALRGPLALPARLVPVLSQHLDAADQVASSGESISRAGVEAATTAPLDELRTSGGQVDLELLGSMAEPVGAVAASLQRAELELTDVDSSWLVPPVADPLRSVTAEIAATAPGAEVTAEAVRLAPALFGADEGRRYAIAFANPAESRFLGGFIGGYGLLSAEDGKLSLDSSGRVDDLTRPPAPVDLGWSPELEARYARWSPGLFLQNASVTPDFPTDARILADLFPAYGLPEVDGVIYVDPLGLAALLELTGPVRVEGLDEPVGPDDVAALLLRRQYQRPITQDERSDLLTDVADATFDALTTDDLPSPGDIVDVLGPAVAGGHLLFEPFDGAEQRLLGRVGARGEFPVPFGTDLVSVRMANDAGNKLDAYISRDVGIDVVLDPEAGTAATSVDVTLRNDAPADLPDYVAGSADARAGRAGAPPTGDDALVVALYSPSRLLEASVDGEPVGVERQPEGSMWASGVRVVVPRGGQVRLRFETLSALDDEGGYSLTWVPQALAMPDDVSVRITSTADEPFAVGPGLRVEDGTATASGPMPEVRRFDVATGQVRRSTSR